MLLAKVDPPSSIVVQDNPFGHSIKNAPYMSVEINPYIPNADLTNCKISFGYYEPPSASDEPQTYPYIFIYDYTITLSSQDLATWGTNDEDLYRIVSNKIGCSIVEFIDVDL
jgi:hypothetical protein